MQANSMGLINADLIELIPTRGTVFTRIDCHALGEAFLWSHGAPDLREGKELAGFY
jgi:hypothetical protein